MSTTMRHAAAWTAALLVALSAVLAGVAGAAAKPMVSSTKNRR